MLVCEETKTHSHGLFVLFNVANMCFCFDLIMVLMRLTFGFLQNNNPIFSWIDVFSSVCVCLRGKGQQFSGVQTEYQCFWDLLLVSVESAEDVSN